MIDWYPAERLNQVIFDPVQQDWLLFPGSTTQRFKTMGYSMDIHLISHQIAPLVFPEAAVYSGVSLGELCLQREILMQYQGKAWLYAKSITSYTDLRDNWASIEYLGQQALGEVLFASQNLKRTPFQFAVIDPNYTAWISRSWLGDRAVRPKECTLEVMTEDESRSQKGKTITTPELERRAVYTARRSCFMDRDKTLALWEVFLPDVWSQFS